MIAQQTGCFICTALYCITIYKLMLLEHIELVPAACMNRVLNSFPINVQLQGQEPDGISRVFISHVLKLLDELWYADDISCPFAGLSGNWKIVLLFSNCHLFLELLIHPIAETLAQIVERCDLRSSLPGKTFNSYGGSFLLFHPLQCMEIRVNKPES